MQKFLQWLAKSPTASALKVILAGGLAAAIDYVDSFHLPPTVALLVVAVVPVIIDALNPHDPRFGKGKTPSLLEFLEALVPVIEKAKPETKPVIDEIAPIVESAAHNPKES